jgi:hypothetical protein
MLVQGHPDLREHVQGLSARKLPKPTKFVINISKRFVIVHPVHLSSAPSPRSSALIVFAHRNEARASVLDGMLLRSR